MKLELNKLSSAVGKLSYAIEKSTLNPQAGFVQITSKGKSLEIVTCGLNYSFVATVPTLDTENAFDVTVSSDTFIPLISKLEDTEIELREELNKLVLTATGKKYVFHIKKDRAGNTEKLKPIPFDVSEDTVTQFTLDKEDIISISGMHSKGIAASADASFVKDCQRYVCIDGNGAITFAESIYLTTFKHKKETTAKVLVDGTQAKLLKVFDSYPSVDVWVSVPEDYEEVSMTKFSAGGITLVFETPSESVISKFPCGKLREKADLVAETHIRIDRKKLEKALSRLMVFDKKWDAKVLDYSQIEFSTDHLRLVSVKNKNYEDIPYISQENAKDYTAIVRLVDLEKTIKALDSGKEIDMSYGNDTASTITINTGNLRQIIREIIPNT